jgi:hypothetical protein
MFGKHRHFTSASFAGSCDQNADVADVWANPSVCGRARARTCARERPIPANIGNIGVPTGIALNYREMLMPMLAPTSAKHRRIIGTIGCCVAA